MIAPVKMAITADDQTAAAFKSVETGLSEIRRAAKATTSSLTAMRRAAADSNQGVNAMASLYGQASQGATAAAASTGAFSRALGVASKAALPLTAAITAMDFVNFAADQARAADAMQDAADIANTSTEMISRYGHVAKMTGTDLDAITTALKFSGRALSEAKNETSQSAQLIRDLGLSVRELRAMSPDAAFEAMGEAVAGLSNEYDRTNASVKLFGRSGNELLPMFKNGAEGVRQLKDEADRLGVTLDSRTAAAFARNADASDRMRSSFAGLVRDLMADALPAVESATNAITRALEGANISRAHDRAYRQAQKASPEIWATYRELWRNEGMAAAVAYWNSWQSETDRLIKSGGLFAGVMARPQLPGQTTEGLEATRLQIQAEGARLRALMKDSTPADVSFGLSDESLAGLRYAAEQYERMSRAANETAHQDWLAEQIGPTDSQAAEEAAAAVRAHEEWLRQATDEYQRLRRESTVTWRLMSAGIENVTDQLSYNMSAALTGIRTQLLEVSDLARSLLNMAIRMGLNYLSGQLMGAISSGSSAAAGGVLQGPTQDGSPLGLVNKASLGGTGRESVRVVSVENVHIRGVLDPTDKMSVRRVAAALVDELETVTGHIGPRGAAA